MQKFICPLCKFESTYDPWHESAHCPQCGYAPPPGMQVSDAESTNRNWRRKQRLARLKFLRNVLILALPCIPLLVAMVIFSQISALTRPELKGFSWPLLAVIILFDIPVILMLSGALLIVERSIIREVVEAWQQLANQTDLTHHPRTGKSLLPSLILGDVGRVSGIYQGYQVSVDAKRVTPNQPATCVTLELQQAIEGDLILTYRHYPDPYALIEAKLTTFKQAFEIQQQPEHFGDPIITSSSLRARLLRLHQGTTLRIHKTRIELQQQARGWSIGGPGVHGLEQDVAYLHFLLDLLSDLAEVIETSSQQTRKSSA